MQIEIRGLDEFKRAIERNPSVVQKQINSFLVKGMAVYNRLIIRNPWRVGMSGGGAPVRTGNLRDTHQRTVERFQARIVPTASYADKIHDGTGKMKARPWLDYAEKEGEKDIERLADTMTENIIKDLAK